jgi:hypothetical protein
VTLLRAACARTTAAAMIDDEWPWQAAADAVDPTLPRAKVGGLMELFATRAVSRFAVPELAWG